MADDMSAKETAFGVVKAEIDAARSEIEAQRVDLAAREARLEADEARWLEDVRAAEEERALRLTSVEKALGAI
jgi:hypothetical protein